MPQPPFINVRAAIAERLRGVLTEQCGAELTQQILGSSERVISPCQDIRFGDYQTNAAMVLAKKGAKVPREVAQEIIGRLDLKDLCDKVDVAGSGFINFQLKPTWIAQQLLAMAAHPHLGLIQVSSPAKMVIDFSSPNIAKSMHVGHIRSTFLGDCISRICRAAGHQVITDNHLGDWGTQFGKLIHGYKNFLDKARLTESPIEEFERLYKKVNDLCESDENVLKQVRDELARLQSGDRENLAIWNEISSLSLREFQKAYARMGISFDHQLGESFYNPMLQELVKEFVAWGIAESSEGAICIFFRNDPELANAAPMIIQKGDGASLYATTDLATIRYRIENWQTEVMIYVTDARQQLHFKQLKAAVKRWVDKTPIDQTHRWRNWPHPPTLQHVYFGSILGEDKKPIKTRSGDPIKLHDLLQEAESRALHLIKEKNPNLTEEEQREAARVLGIGSLKYADMCQNRNLDYIFDWNKLLALQGNTAPYLIYAYVRTRSIFRSLPTEFQLPTTLQLSDPHELALAKLLIRYGDTIHSVLEDFRPHILCAYLHDLAVTFSKFYENCPVLKAHEPAKSTRLTLSELTSRVLKNGLQLLGIETLEKM